MEVFIEQAFNYGLPTAILGLVLYGIWKAVAWLGPNFLTPIKDQVILHLSKIDTAIDAMMILIRGQTEALERQNEVLRRVEARSDKTGVENQGHTQVLARIDENVLELKQSAKQFFRESHTDHEQKNHEHHTEHG